MEANEDYAVGIQRDHGSWETVASLVRGTDFVNNYHHAGDWRGPLAGAPTVNVRFRRDATDNSDAVYLDDVTVSAR